MRHTLLLLGVFLSAAFVQKTYGQFWESTHGPGGDYVRCFTSNAKGDLFVVSKRVHRSTDHGRTWQWIAGEIDLLNDDYHGGSRIACGADGTIYLVTPRTLFVSETNGDTWNKVFDFKKHYSAIAISSRNVLLTTNVDSVLTSVDKGKTWSAKKATNGSWPDATFADSTGTLYVGAGMGNNYRSTNDGASWMKLSNGFPNGYLKAVHSVAEHIYALVSNQVCCSLDSGRTWSILYTASSDYIENLHFAANSLFLIYSDGMIERSTDEGSS